MLKAAVARDDKLWRGWLNLGDALQQQGDNLAADKTFRTPEDLRARFTASLAGTPPDHVICYCGSGVTACHNLLALEHAGLTGAKLYVGSWSEWSADPARPVERG